MNKSCGGCLYEGINLAIEVCITCKRAFKPGCYSNLTLGDNYVKRDKEEKDEINRNISNL